MMDTIEKRGAVWAVLAESGEVLGEYATQEEAAERLRQVEAAKSAEVAKAIENDDTVKIQDRRDRAVQRLDRVGLRVDAGSVRELANGMVELWGVATRVGVFEYEDEGPTGVRREYRSTEEVMRRGSLATLVGVPFTIDHPEDGSDVHSGNAASLTHGWVLDVEPVGDLIRAKIRVATDAAKAAIAAGKIELSCGYTANIDAKSGVSPKGEPFDAMQRDIVYNHLALVDFARAGHVARLHLDGVSVQRETAVPGAQPMKSFKLVHTDGRKLDLPAVLALGMLTASADPKADAAEVATVTIEQDGEVVSLVLPKGMVDEIAKMIGLLPAEAPAAPPADAPAGEAPPAEEPPMDAKADAAMKRIADKAAADAIARYDARNRERSKVERQAVLVLDSGYAWERATTAQIMVDVISKVDAAKADEAAALAKASRNDDRAMGRLDAMFDASIAAHKSAADSSATLMGALLGAAVHDSAPARKDPRQAMIDRRSKRAAANE